MTGQYRYFEKDATLKDKRFAIKQYTRREGNQHRFQMMDGTIYEGFVVEMSKENLFFSRNYDPASPDADLSPFDIPIARITALID